MQGHGSDQYKFNQSRCGKALLAAVAVLVLLGGCGADRFLEKVERDMPLRDIPLREISLQEEKSSRTLYLEEVEKVGKPVKQTGNRRKLFLDSIELSDQNFLYSGVSRYAYDSLSDSEKLWYQDMEKALGTMAEKVKLADKGLQAGLDEGVVDKIFQCVLRDHPELFYVEGYSYTRYTRSEQTVMIEFSGTYSQDRETVRARRRQIEEAVSALLADAPRFGEDFDKAKYVYETLIRNTDYDMDAPDNQNIYSVFVNHASVCQGYAKAVQYLLNRMGIFCTLVQGRVLETGEGHAWNLVMLDGAYYYLDATWGDISYQDPKSTGVGKLARVSYDYLCVTTKQLQRTHDIDEQLQMPVCSAVQDNYYVHEGALFEKYDKEKLERLVALSARQGREDITLQCADEDCFQEMVDILIEKKKIFDFLSDTGSGSFAYVKNDIQLTLTFFVVTSE